MLYADCPQCNKNTAGQHNPNCPNNPDLYNKYPGVYIVEQVYGKLPIFRMGWKCPRCRRIWNPDIKSCDCEEI